MFADRADLEYPPRPAKDGGRSMLRESFNESLKVSLKQKNQRALSTIRLILTAIRDRDIAERTKGNVEGIDDREIMRVLQTMVRQRQEAIALYEQGGRLELAEQEAEEIAIIRGFLPQQLSDDEITDAICGVVSEIQASSIKDMGRAMGILRERYSGKMDFAKASAVLKQQLTAS